MRYEQYQRLLDHVLGTCGKPQELPEPRLIHPVELAYIGDAVFSLYVLSLIHISEPTRP